MKIKEKLHTAYVCNYYNDICLLDLGKDCSKYERNGLSGLCKYVFRTDEEKRRIGEKPK